MGEEAVVTERVANVRAAALTVLLEILEEGELSHLALRRGLRENPDLDRQQRAFLSRLVEGTVERLLELDYVIGQYAHTPLKKMKPVIRTILRMSVYQLLYMDAVPDSAVCNEAVKLAARRGYAGLKGFVNGTLRKIAAEKGELSYPPEDTRQGLSVRYSMPEWIVGQWMTAYGDEVTKRMLRALLEERPLIVHRSTSRVETEALCQSLLAEGVEMISHPYEKDAWMLKGQGLRRLDDLEAFRKGWIQVQDISSQLASLLAVQALQRCAREAKKGQPGSQPCRVLDICAAPGGKSVYVADAILARGLPAEICSRDVSEEKVSLIRQNQERLGLANLNAEVWDAREFDASWEQRADVVIADLPCSGLGIMARKSDIKYRMTCDQLQELAVLQRRILSVAWRYVKVGGYLIYSTCTIDSRENEENFRWFWEQYPFEPVNLCDWLPNSMWKTDEEGMGEIHGKMPEKISDWVQITGCRPKDMQAGHLQLLPGIHDSDGFFLSALRRKGDTP